ncbi:uncharacterized protein Z518_05985 [Rhinocladiella mackenziei CBS 650.93]|uniref:Sulfotransferase family protein n=1 Tax=Rhinocladiella mackenziei CBS 650.93 TaxID=1442369 RepID=A0A0D2H3Y9_9EURO|nr:uncharacterized protein Z518_05985 [Rhinocladiella mackenziei CBS 650.93]KIX05113.1 hypothetical protein Z518_05985 [Rhinocladiella mackenziei CBS 650.93]
MSRRIDQFPEPGPSQRRVKLVVASVSRTGTLGLYQALQILGYKVYHMGELVLVGGVPHMEILDEGVRAQFNRFSGILRYDKAEFDKWFADYDVLIEIPSFFGLEMLEAYLADPEVKFLLTERSPDSWVKSFNNFVGVNVQDCESPPLSILRYFNKTLRYFYRVNRVIYSTFSENTRIGDQRNEEYLRQNYVRYIERVKKIIPPERLYVLRLEDGLGWNEICPYLGKPIPDVKYPQGQEHADLKARLLAPLIRDAVMKIGLLTAPAVGVGAWFAWKRFGR